MKVNREISRPFISLFKYTHTPQLRQIDTRVPFVKRGFQLVCKMMYMGNIHIYYIIKTRYIPVSLSLLNIFVFGYPIRLVRQSSSLVGIRMGILANN